MKETSSHIELTEKMFFFKLFLIFLLNQKPVHLEEDVLKSVGNGCFVVCYVYDNFGCPDKIENVHVCALNSGECAFLMNGFEFCPETALYVACRKYKHYVPIMCGRWKGDPSGLDDPPDRTPMKTSSPLVICIAAALALQV